MSSNISSRDKDAFLEEDAPWMTCATCWGLSSHPVIAQEGSGASAGASRAFPPALKQLAPAPALWMTGSSWILQTTGEQQGLGAWGAWDIPPGER